MAYNLLWTPTYISNDLPSRGPLAHCSPQQPAASVVTRRKGLLEHTLERCGAIMLLLSLLEPYSALVYGMDLSHVHHQWSSRSTTSFSNALHIGLILLDLDDARVILRT